MVECDIVKTNNNSCTFKCLQSRDMRIMLKYSVGKAYPLAEASPWAGC